jgi:hypothetical protein
MMERRYWRRFSTVAAHATMSRSMGRRYWRRCSTVAAHAMMSRSMGRYWRPCSTVAAHATMSRSPATPLFQLHACVAHLSRSIRCFDSSRDCRVISRRGTVVRDSRVCMSHCDAVCGAVRDSDTDSETRSDLSTTHRIKFGRH